MNRRLAVVSEDILKRLEGHPERMLYQSLVGQIVKIVPRSEFTSRSKDGAPKSFVKIIPMENGEPRKGWQKAIPIASQFLIFFA